MTRRVLLPLALLLALAPRGPASGAPDAEVVRFPGSYAPTPDGRALVFAWRGDLWEVAATGGDARRLTFHPAADADPCVSPDGEHIAFVSTRSGTAQVWVMPRSGGAPRRITTHTEACRLEGFFPDGEAVLVRQARDHDWRRAERLFRRPLDPALPSELIFDDYAGSASVSPDGRRIAFTREGVRWTRKGYRGSQASQVWIHDLDDGSFTRVTEGDHGERWPLWMPDGSGLVLVSQEDGTFNLWHHDLETGTRTQWTRFEDDGVVAPAMSADGAVLVFRRLGETWRLRPGSDLPAHAMEIVYRGDPTVETVIRRTLDDATEVAFTEDAKEIAFVAGGDLWVMDTELREPRLVVGTPDEVRSACFAPDHDALYFVMDTDARPDVWVARRSDPERFWWQNETFEPEQLTDDAEPESALSFTPDGERLLFRRGRGDLYWMRPDGSEATRLVASTSPVDYAVSPDGRWLAYATEDADFNRDVWLVPTDLSREAINVSRHPDDDGNPTFSPDGKLLAFTGRRWDDERDICYVWLRREDEERTRRDRQVEKAIEAMKGRKKAKKNGEGKKDAEAKKEEGGKEEKEPVVVDVDPQGIADRIHRIRIPNTAERSLLWMGDGAKLAFVATVDGKEGLYTVTFPDALEPKRLSGTTGRDARWLGKARKIGWLVDGKPATLDAGGRGKTFPFQVRQRLSVSERHAAAFDQAWRVMGETFYDPTMNGRNWDALRTKYRPLAAAAGTPDELDTVVDLLLGELNASHMGFSATRDRWSPGGWVEETGHLGLRLEAGPDGPVVVGVVPHSPADRGSSRIEKGETILAVDDTPTGPNANWARLLTGQPERTIVLRVRGSDQVERDVPIRPVSARDIRRLLYDAWVDENEARVESWGEGRLGYLHVRGMNWSSFQAFEEALYKAGHGRDGLVIDVRDNGGGFTADHLLTSLTQPRHAFTVPRGGGPGYPQDRMVYARWTKPIVVLVNQNSFSNAEIFAHAIRTLGRGQLVGVPTAGGVISTGRTNIMDVGSLRLPFRGWFTLPDGEDMERAGCRPDHVVWPEPGDEIDRQLKKAAEVLLADVEAFAKRPSPRPHYASERDE